MKNSLFSIIGLHEFSKLDCARLGNHLKKIILNTVTWNSTPATKQLHFKDSLICWETKVMKKLGLRLLPQATVLGRSHRKMETYRFIYTDLWNNGFNAWMTTGACPWQKGCSGSGIQGCNGGNIFSSWEFRVRIDQLCVLPKKRM